MERIPASERTREKLKAVIEGTEKGAGASELVRLAARLIIEEALEGEARDVLGREYYARGAAPGAGYRNGYRTGRLDSAEGRIEYSAPQIADRLHLGQPREAVLAAWGLLAARRRCCTWRRAPRRTRPAAASSFTTCVGAACPIRCWWSATARPASSARSKNASRARCGNAVWRTRCAIWQAKCPKTSGLSSRPVAA